MRSGTYVPARLFALKDLQVASGAILASGIDSNAPTTRTVNGLVNPVLTLAPGETQRWAFANIGADIFYSVALPQHTFTIIGQDGNPVHRITTADTLVLPPGKRYEVLVQGGDAGDHPLTTTAYDQGGDMYPAVTLATVRIGGDARAPAALPIAGLVPFVDLRTREVARRATKTFSEKGESDFRINGKTFDIDRVDDNVKLGTVEEWTLRNDTDEQHPFHIHIEDFQVISVNGAAADPFSEQETVILPAKGEVVVRIPFDDFTGKFVYHCHILAHEDSGMMATIAVNP